MGFGLGSFLCLASVIFCVFSGFTFLTLIAISFQVFLICFQSLSTPYFTYPLSLATAQKMNFTECFVFLPPNFEPTLSYPVD